MSGMMTIDGSQGEGGGQILRTALSLSAITGRGFELVNIRAKRSVPGLKRQHLTCVRAVAEICGATVTGAEVGSRRLAFAPGVIKSGDYRFEIGTAGSVTLVAQTVIPVLLKADGVSTVTITGGTHVPYAPVWEFFAETYLPELRRMGAEIEAELVRPGFYPAAGGEVMLRIKPFDEARRREYALTDLGAPKRGMIAGIVSALPLEIAESEVRILAGKFAALGLAEEVRTVESLGPGNCCFVRLDYERASVVFSGIGTYDRSRKAVANEVASQVASFLKAGMACEKHLADQLLVPLAVLCRQSGKGGELAISAETEHFRTNQVVVATFMHDSGR